MNSINVILIKCINGEEILARVERKIDDGILVKKPVTIHIGQTPNGQMSAQLIPSLMGIDDGEIFIPNTAIMMEAKTAPREDLKNKYIEMTTGIQLINT